MALVRRLQAAAQEAPPIGANPSTTRWVRLPFMAAPSRAGKLVTVEAALGLDTVWDCVMLKASATGQLPVEIFKRLPDGEAQPAPTYYANRILGSRPNAEHTPITLLSLIEIYLNTWGNSYIGKSFDSAGRVADLWPIRSDLVRVSRKDGIKQFWIRDADTRIEYPKPFTSGEIIHVMGFSLDGLRGMSRIEMARETIGAGLAMDHYNNVFWRNSAIPPTVLTSDNEIDEAGRRRVRRDWERAARGFRNAWRTVILEQGLKPTQLSIPDADKAFVTTGQYSDQKICRWFGVYPSMIGASSGDSLTYKTVEGETLRFKMFTMNWDWTAIEQAFAADTDLFPVRTGDVQPQYFPKINRDKLLEIDPLTKAKIFATANGRRAWMLPSEQRRELHLPPNAELDDPTYNPFDSGGSGSGGVGSDAAD